MHKVFYDQFKLKKAKYNFKRNNKNNIEFVSSCLKFINKVLNKEKPTHVIIQGDTDTTLTGALATNLYNRNLNDSEKIKILHVEAGLRSFDERMPEEINRKITDNLSDFLFVPTKFEYNNLKKENLIKSKKIKIVGNTIAESLKKIIKYNFVNKKFKKNFFLLTLHRPETVDNSNNFIKLLKNLNDLGKKFNTDYIFPIHPRSKNRVSRKILSKLKYLKIIKPLNYVEFISMLRSCKIVFTDSGGIQEESYILNKPCITIRDNTERQVTTKYNTNIIAGYKKNKIESAIKYLLNKKIKNKNIFGNDISKKIISEIQ